MRSVLFHEYARFSGRRSKVNLFWENKPRQSAGVYEASIRRLTALIEMDPSRGQVSYSRQGESRYGLGNERPASLFYKLFLIDVHGRSTRRLCKWVRDGRMHRDFTRHLRSTGKGIDYTQLVEYNTSVHVPTSSCCKDCTETNRRIWC
mmetsp:Transcript_2789/g.5810  ORF Transcript_2789/g.5810 Transcript_2789/m.5810 type:complete len:148 (-) Transcript_2789:206-649(-)